MTFNEVLICDFNPRSYKRSDILSVINYCGIHYFNPRSYKRSDLKVAQKLDPATHFNPRSYKRSDVIKRFNVYVHFISIHAPTRGATMSSESGNAYPIDFNPRSYKRSDRWYGCK